MDSIRYSFADTSLDHALLVAGAAVSQASSPTARLAQQIARRHRPRFESSLGALVEVFAARDAGAADALEGSFHPQVARTPSERAR